MEDVRHELQPGDGGDRGRHALPLIDLYHDFKDREDFFLDESHFTREGHERAARIVYRHLLPFFRGEARSVR